MVRHSARNEGNRLGVNAGFRFIEQIGLTKCHPSPSIVYRDGEYGRYSGQRIRLVAIGELEKPVGFQRHTDLLGVVANLVHAVSVNTGSVVVVGLLLDSQHGANQLLAGHDGKERKEKMGKAHSLPLYPEHYQFFPKQRELKRTAFLLHKDKPMLTVVIDVREREVWNLLEPWTVDNSDGWLAVQRPLDVGDIAFVLNSEEVPQVVLERKSVEDLGASLADGRYREQRTRLLALRGQGSSIGYIVEVPPWSPSLSRSWCRGTFNEVQVQNTLVRLQFRYTIPVFQAGSVQDTVFWIRRIAKQLVTDPTAFRSGLADTRIQVAAAYKDAIHTKKASNTTQDIVFQSMLQTIPGLGKLAVEAISALTQSSFQTLLFLTEEELAAIDTGKRKLGAKMAGVLFRFLHT